MSRFGGAAATGGVALATVALALPEGAFAPGVVAAIAVVSSWAMIALLVTGVAPLAPIPRPAIVAATALAGIGLLAGVSMAWASDDGRAFAEAVRVAAYLQLFLLVVATSRRQDAAPWLAGLGFGLAAVAALALASRLIGPYPGGDAEIAAMIPSARDRLSYPIGYWNGLAALMAVAATLLVWLGASGRSRPERVLAGALLPLPLLTLYLTDSRGGWLALIVGIAVIVLTSRRLALHLASAAIAAPAAGAVILFAATRDDLVAGLDTGAAEREGFELLVALLVAVGIGAAVRARLDGSLTELRLPPLDRRGRLVALGVAIAGAVAALSFAGPAELVSDFTRAPTPSGLVEGRDRGAGADGYPERRPSLVGSSGRYQLWEGALDAFADDPLKGIGAGQFSGWWNRYGSLTTPVQNAHSLFVESLAELGLAGFLLVLTFFGIAVAEGFRRLRAGNHAAGAALAVLCAAIASAMLEWTWELPGVFAPAIVAVALLTGPATARTASGTAAGPARGRLRLVLASVCALGLAAGGVQLASEVELARSRAAVRSGDLEAAVSHARKAASIEPWASEQRLQEAAVQIRAGDLEAAREAVEEAIARAPHEWRPWGVKARIEQLSGNPNAAQEALRQGFFLLPGRDFEREGRD